jgi:hypothetical protein
MQVRRLPLPFLGRSSALTHVGSVARFDVVEEGDAPALRCVR